MVSGRRDSSGRRIGTWPAGPGSPISKRTGSDGLRGSTTVTWERSSGGGVASRSVWLPIGTQSRVWPLGVTVVVLMASRL